MRVNYGSGRTEFGPGVEINLTGDEVALAVHAWLTAHDVHIQGPSTISVNGSLCERGLVYVDPSGSVIVNGKRVKGR